MSAETGRPTFFAEYASFEILSSSAAEWVPIADGLRNGAIPRDRANFVRDKFVYLFLSDNVDWNSDLAELIGLKEVIGFPASKHPLLVLITLDENGTTSGASGKQVEDAVLNRTSIPFASAGDPFFTFPAKHPRHPRHSCFAIVSRTELPPDSIRKFADERPPQIPLFDLFGTDHFAFIADDAKLTPADPEWVLFVVDPLTITENLTKKLSAASDEYLRHTQAVSALGHENEKEILKRQDEARVRLQQKAVADNVKGLIDADPSLADELEEFKIAAGPKRRTLDDFSEGFDRTLELLTRRRDEAAVELIHWLESSLWGTVDESFRLPKVGGAPLDGYEEVLLATCDALSVLAETNPGLSYCLNLLGVKPSSKAEGSLAFALNEFVLRDEPGVPEVAKVASKAGTALYGAWARFVAIEHRRNLVRLSEIGLAAWIEELQDLPGIPEPLSQSVTGLGTFRMSRRLNNAYNANLTEVFHRFIRLDVATDKGVIQVEEVLDLSFGVKGSESLLNKLGLNGEHVSGTLAIVNVALAGFAVQEAFSKEASLRDKVFTIIDLSGAVVGAGEAFYARLVGRVSNFATSRGPRQGIELAKRAAVTAVARRLGLLASVMSMVSIGNKLAKEFQEKDFDAAVGAAIEGVGVILVAGGTVMLLSSPKGGPAVHYVFIAGTLVSLTGYVITALSDDTELVKLVKFGAFGTQKGADAPAPAWALCPNNSFKDWNPKTTLGLALQLEAFNNLQFAFRVTGVSGSRGTLRILPGMLLTKSVFHISVTAIYGRDLPAGLPETDPERDARHVRTTKLAVQVAQTENGRKAVVRLKEGNVIVLSAIETLTVDGREALDIAVVPDNRGSDRNEVIKFRRLDKMVFEVLLDVHGDDATLLIPSSKGGEAATMTYLAFDRENSGPAGFDRGINEEPAASSSFHL